MGLPSRLPLFRQEVIEFQRHNRQWGRVVPLQPMPVRVTVWSISAAAAAIIGFLFIAQYARKETVTGTLVPEAGSARIFAPQPGTISAVHVAQGERVIAGQPLLSVAIEQIAGNGEDVNASILGSLDRQVQALARQIAAETRRGQSEAGRIAAQIEGAGD